ncbi:MarR family transcriptional regulator [Candidatus Microgenomates bacterium]|nr:MarR family transcriptional regulator [Candidatus Microgenomates bacterium]
MPNLKISVLFRLYLLGRKIRKFAKHENYDQIFEASVLTLLHEQPLTISEIGEKLSTNISSASEKLMEMEVKELITKSQGKDHRSIKLELTKKGDETIDSLHEIMANHCGSVFDKLEESEIMEMEKILGKMAG